LHASVFFLDPKCMN